MGYQQEFDTVDLVLTSNAETRGVDAFALALIKCERQARKLVTHLVFQFPCFNCTEIPELRAALNSTRKVYFEGFIQGFDALYPISISSLIGKRHGYLRSRLEEAIQYRNKIFHGQLTTKSLSRNELLDYVTDIRDWCCLLAESSLAEIGYDGFLRNSFQKSEKTELWKRYKIQFSGVADYHGLIRKVMQRH